jgi:hypothetical protein
MNGKEDGIGKGRQRADKPEEQKARRRVPGLMFDVTGTREIKAWIMGFGVTLGVCVVRNKG